MAWVILLVAILFEVTGTTSMKLSQGFQQPLPSVMVFICYGISIALLTVAVKTIDISVAYAIWCAVGTVLIASIGILWFGEPATLWRLVWISLIIVSVVGLNLASRLSG